MNNHHDEPKTESEAPESFVPPRHWIGPEELEAGYWKDSGVQEKRAQEFFEKPIEYIEKIDKLDKTGIARRDFLTIMGASMAMASFACARRPVHKIIPYVVKPEEVTPGVATWYASTCEECGERCGILIKNREGRPIKLEGNPDHPLNQGKLCARGQASLLNLYDPDRLKAPLSRVRGGASRELSWQEADSVLQKKIVECIQKGGQVRVLTGEIQSESTRSLISEFLQSFKGGSHVEFEPLAFDEIVTAQQLTYGNACIPNYHFEKAEMVVSLGADFLGNWVSPMEHAQRWSRTRKVSDQKPSQAKISKLICFESSLSITGANADERTPVRPGDELKVALALIHELLVIQKRSSFANETALTSVVSAYSPEKVSGELGMEHGAASLKKIATELWENKGKSLVVAGGLQTKTEDSVALQIAANLLNSILENEGKTVDGTLAYASSRASYSEMAKLIQEMKLGQVQVLIISKTNPAYTLPQTSGFAEALKKVPLVIVIAEHDDETALLADYVLPSHHYLENWGDAQPRKGLFSLQQPALAPIHSTRGFQDVFISWIKGISKAGLKATGNALKVEDWHGYLQTYWKENLYKQSGSPASFDQFWQSVLRVGVLDLRNPQGKASSRSFRTAAAAKMAPSIKRNSGALSLVLYAKMSLYDGRSANNAWLQEMPDPISTVAWDNYLNVSPALAKKLSLAADDVVEVSANGTSVHLPVYIQPGLHSDVVTAAVGYGRRAVGKVGNQTGIDVFPFAKPTDSLLVFSGSPVTVRKTGKFYKLAATQWHHVTENRPVINDITLAEFRKDPATANHTDPHLRLETVPTLWPTHTYANYRWGMAIDLNSCIGCGACVVACQAENNIPVVGRNQVRVSRQMHWLRIDRYYSGSIEKPEVVFQPMLCQHCENAPCETVCPVLATVHDDEGLNVQVYNRCVGTRYCQNNCPYKVRRFNFFDHWKAYETTLNMVWNPDVSVRTRGIMEKCTFCVQRIRDAKDRAKDSGDRVRDGDFQTACQQTCPTDAIVFGNVNDPESRVSRMKASPQAFRVLEVLNTKPSVSYMTKVRNKAEGVHSHSAERRE